MLRSLRDSNILFKVDTKWITKQNRKKTSHLLLLWTLLFLIIFWYDYISGLLWPSNYLADRFIWKPPNEVVWWPGSFWPIQFSSSSSCSPKVNHIQNILECMARYAGKLLAAAEGFSLWSWAKTKTKTKKYIKKNIYIYYHTEKFSRCRTHPNRLHRHHSEKVSRCRTQKGNCICSECDRLRRIETEWSLWLGTRHMLRAP